jgi:hypothetical protein
VDVANLITRLRADKIIALGSHIDYPAAYRDRVAAFPRLCTITQYEQIIEAAFKSKRVAIAIVTGSLVAEQYQARLLAKVTACLPKSRVVCLNVGEIRNVSTARLNALEAAVASSYVGNMYLADPINPAERARKNRLKEMLHTNKRKEGYRSQLARDDAWQLLRVGCQAWFNPTEQARAAAGVWANNDWPQRCKRGCASHNPKNPGPGQRCRGISSLGKRCCLCTRHVSKYCHHHV